MKIYIITTTVLPLLRYRRFHSISKPTILLTSLLLGLIVLTLLSRKTVIDTSCKTLKRQTFTRSPTIYAVTPTYARFVQKAELTRLSHTILHVPNLHWIIVEDSHEQTNLVGNLVQRLYDDFHFNNITLLHSPTPERFKLKPGQPSWKFPKGIWQRNRAISWIADNIGNLDPDGVVYFADDDNTYDLKLFEEMRRTRKVSVWPVGFVGGMLVEKPIVEDGRVVGFNSMWRANRPFPIDMAGFAVSLKTLISDTVARFSSDNKIGYVESHFLSQLVSSWDQLEPRADNCSKVLVWHTKTQKPAMHEEKKLPRSSSLGLEL